MQVSMYAYHAIQVMTTANDTISEGGAFAEAGLLVKSMYLVYIRGFVATTCVIYSEHARVAHSCHFSPLSISAVDKPVYNYQFASREMYVCVHF